MSDVFHRVSMVMNVDQAEIAKIVHDYLERGIVSDYDRLNCPPPPIPIRPVKIKTLKEKLEEMQMKSTSKQEINNVRDICFSIENDPIEMESKLTITATTDDDIFSFEFEGEHLIQSCKRVGLFAGWEKDQRIRELEKENKELKAKSKYISDDNALLLETNKKLKQSDMLDKEAADYWSNEHDTLLERFRKLQVENEKLKDKLENVEPFRSLERTIKEKQQLKEEYENKLDVLQRKYNLEKAANEAQRKFIKEYAGDGTEIEFNYAIGDTDEVTYVIIGKEKYKALKDDDWHVMIHGKDYTPDELVDRILELEALKTPTIENFADEKTTDNVNHPSHYTGRYECIDVMQDVFGDEATDNFCLCNAFKYIWRARKKNGLEDVKKAVWYLNKYIEEAEKDGVSKG